MNLLCFGCGYVAQKFSGFALKEGAVARGTTRNKITVKPLRDQSIRPLIYREGQPLDAAVLKEATHILISIPPSQNGDFVLKDHGEMLKHSRHLKWVGYLSATGVYGDHQGNWVNEESPCLTSQAHNRRRLKAEAAWLEFLKNYDIPVHLFRLSGIYGPERSIFNQIRNGTVRSIHKAGHFFSRIHIDDIVQTLWASVNHSNPGEIYNLADDKPAPMSEIINYACRLLRVEPPPLIAFEEAILSEKMQAFYRENKRVSNSKIKDKLHIKLLYPTYREGLKSLYQTLKFEENETWAHYF